MPRNFTELLRAKWDEGKFVCVGLDAVYKKIPEHLKANRSFEDAIFEFNKVIVTATQTLVCAYKPNTAFYEAYGDEGLRVLKRTCDFIREVAPTVPVILDAKRGDIGDTNLGYVSYGYEWLAHADAMTVHPYLGEEALRPFLDMKDKGVIVLCKTSNKGSDEFQDLKVDGIPLYQIVAKNVSTMWNKNGNCLLVAGATYPEELGEIRKIVGDLPLLIPGIGKQGGDVEKVVMYGHDSKKQGMVINSSSGIIFASSGTDFEKVARIETQKLHDLITSYNK